MHSTIVLRGGGVIFSLSMIVWTVMMVARGHDVVPYLPFLCGLVMILRAVPFTDRAGRVWGRGAVARGLISRRAGPHFARQRGKKIDDIG